MAHNPNAPQSQPYEYAENSGNMAHPLSELQLGGAEVAAINTAMEGIQERRQELAAQNPRQLFAGIMPDTGYGSTLLVVDSNKTGTRHPQYVVRAMQIGDGAAPATEEYIPDDLSQRTYDRSPIQTIRTSLGTIDIGTGSPDSRFESKGTDSVPFASIHGSDGKVRRVVSLDDALRPPTQGELVKAARNALDVSRHAERYPNVNNDKVNIGGRWVSSERLDIVNHALQPVIQALGAEGMSRTDRERLVNLGHRIVSEANNNPENNRRGVVLNAQEAEYMAYAEEKGRQLPKGLFGRRRQRNEEETTSAVYAAQDEYRRSLRQPQRDNR